MKEYHFLYRAASFSDRRRHVSTVGKFVLALPDRSALLLLLLLLVCTTVAHAKKWMTKIIL